MQSVWIFRHIECEGPGFLQQILDRYQIPYRLFAVDKQCRIPAETEDAGALVFMGGPMSVNDNEPWIKQELDLIQCAHQQHLPMLGHCLGAQLISKALGAKVYPNHRKEIGWLPVQRIDSSENNQWLEILEPDFEVFHWHGETFDLPAGAMRILKSADCLNQAYVLGPILALQCHIEVTSEIVKQWIDCYPDEISLPSVTVQNAEQMLDDVEIRCQRLHGIAEVFYRYWLNKAGLI
ncbi:MAG: gamma-glutamyl-gamma-aminobutyrate hydrolase family protein [Gammaproteobacteria bacterium]|nr:gamma-glutamyl-gamma-aminobutyrate hydrolase family protein [Gammaproteobacteria bacterium]